MRQLHWIYEVWNGTNHCTNGFSSFKKYRMIEPIWFAALNATNHMRYLDNEDSILTSPFVSSNFGDTQGSWEWNLHYQEAKTAQSLIHNSAKTDWKCQYPFIDNDWFTEISIKTYKDRLENVEFQQSMYIGHVCVGETICEWTVEHVNSFNAILCWCTLDVEGNEVILQKI